MSTTPGFGGGSPYIRETTKVSEIKDRFGNTRFKVALTDFDDNGLPQDDDLNQFDWTYQVTVVSYCYSQEALTVVCRDFDLYENALCFFDDMVRQYAGLVKAETSDVQDIRLYAERTGYHKICPNCCATCKWARPCDRNNCLFGDWKAELRGKFLCMNAELYRLPSAQEGSTYEPHRDEDLRVVDIHPIVEAHGLCNGFESKADEKYRDPAHSEWRFRNQDMSPDNRLETIAKYEVREQMRGAKEDITRTVGEAIEQQMQNNAPIIEGNRNLGTEVTFDGGGID